MRSVRAATLALDLMVIPFAAFAGGTTVVLDVHHAGCVLCGPIVKSALKM